MNLYFRIELIDEEGKVKNTDIVPFDSHTTHIYTNGHPTNGIRKLMAYEFAPKTIILTPQEIKALK